MKVGIIPVGQVGSLVLSHIAEGLTRFYPDTTAAVIEVPLDSLVSAYDKKRCQYNSTIILDNMRSFVKQKIGFTTILGVIDADVYASGFNYVFGQALSHGKVALVSLWRLKPEFYGEDQDLSLYDLRILKEAVHEVGHTLGLQHCHRNFCVMHFSNSIFDTDKKQSLFCDQCYLQAATAINNLG
jgi:archaemetzincin